VYTGGQSVTFFLTLKNASVFVIEEEFREATFSGKPKTKMQ
jgi:hypothetical protein